MVASGLSYNQRGGATLTGFRGNRVLIWLRYSILGTEWPQKLLILSGTQNKLLATQAIGSNRPNGA